MIECKFWVFAKSKDSTAIPPEQADQISYVFLKTPTDMLHPVINVDISTGGVGNFKIWSTYNYCYLYFFNRFYYITDQKITGKILEISMEVDPLTSWRSYIGASTQYILRAATGENPIIPDTNRPISPDSKVKVNRFTNQIPTVSNYGEGFYVLGITSAIPQVGSVSYYAMTSSQFRTFNNFMFSENPAWLLDSITEIGEGLTKALINPYQYLNSVHYFPLNFRLETIGSAVTEIPYGWWKFATPGYLLNSKSINGLLLAGNLHNNPQSTLFPWANQQPYTARKFNWPCFGSFDLEYNMYKYGKIALEYNIDLITGDATIIPKLWADDKNTENGIPITRKFSIPIATANLQYTAALETPNKMVSFGENLARGNIGGMLSDITTGIHNNLFDTGTYNSSGSNGSISLYAYQPEIISSFRMPLADGATFKGMPCCKEDIISNHPGFIMCTNPKTDFPATSTELDAIKTYMAEGFYYE